MTYQNPKTHECPTCGYVWNHGKHGGHSCSDRLLADNKALKAQVNQLLKACQLYGDSIVTTETLDKIERADTIVIMTPEQCLNSVKADAINDFINDVANMDVKGNKGTNHHEFYKAALRNVFLCGTHTVNKLRANNEKS